MECLVTGAATARLFAFEGAKLVLVDMNEEKGAALEAELKSEGIETLFLKADVTNEEEMKNVFDTTLSTFGNVGV